MGADSGAGVFGAKLDGERTKLGLLSEPSEKHALADGTVPAPSATSPVPEPVPDAPGECDSAEAEAEAEAETEARVSSEQMSERRLRLLEPLTSLR